MSTLGIVLIAVAGALILLAAGGALANARLHRRREADFAERLARADAALASAYAGDKGWERGALEAAARREWASQRPGVALRELRLVEVVDRPGKEDDLAVFHAVGDQEAERLTLGRRGDAWYAAGLERAGA